MTGLLILLTYVAIFVVTWIVVTAVVGRALSGFNALKTVTFGDESAVSPSRAASVISIVTLFLIWGSFTGSSLLPSFLHAPGPFMGDTQFTYTAEDANGNTDDAIVFARVVEVGTEAEDPVADGPDEGFAKNDTVIAGAWRSELIRVDRNDEIGRDEGHNVIAINGQPIEPGGRVRIDDGEVGMTPKGTLNFIPAKGLQMEPIWLPSPEGVWQRFLSVSTDGYQNFTLLEHLGYSLFRVVLGFLFGALVGIPLGYAMGLSGWFRGWFDPIVEFMRPVPPLALIPLVIIWAGIGETGKIILLFLAALWIMTIAARAGVSGVNITKVHAAYSLGASKWQLMRHVIMPNSLPEIFTGARVAMGVCWGTVVAAELVAAEVGAGMMIMVASRFQLTDIVIMGIILIGIIGFGIDILMRMAEKKLVPWKGRS